MIVAMDVKPSGEQFTFPLDPPELAWCWLALLRMDAAAARAWIASHSPEELRELGDAEYDRWRERSDANAE